MKRSLATVAVGVLVLAGIAGFYALVRVTSEKLGPDESYTLYALFVDASGLAAKSRVVTAGIDIGQIEAHDLDPDGSGKAKVTIRIKKDMKIYEDALISKKSASLLGEFYLQVDPGSPSLRRLQPNERIKKVYEPQEIGAAIDSLNKAMPVLQDILVDVRSLTKGPITDIATNINDLISTNSKTLERLLGRMDAIAASVEGVTTGEAEDVKAAIKNAREITESLKTLVGSTSGEIGQTGGAVRDTLNKLQGSVDHLQKTMANLEDVSRKVKEGEGTVGHLLTDDTIARNVEDITTDAGSFIRGVTKLQTIVGLRSEYNFLAGTLKSYVSVQLMPRPDKFYLIEIVDDPRGSREETTTVTESSDMGTVSSHTVTVSEKLRFSFQFGKRVGMVTGRFGIKESTGGVGADLHFLEDRLALSFDLFDTRANVYPRLTARAGFTVVKHVALVAGADDILNGFRSRAGAGGFRDFFAGASLTFNDEDLRTLLLFGGSAIGSASSGK